MPVARRVLNAFADDMPEFDRRQMGCMAGIFQIFDRQRMLTARRAGAGGRQPQQKRLPAGRTPPESSSNVPVQSSSTPKIILEKTLSKSMTENSSLSIESSRASCSSSSCSSFSSIDGSKSAQQELPYISEELFPQRSPKSSPSLKGADMDTKTAQPNVGFRDIVKDSINRDSGGLTVMTTANGARRNAQYKDSPRPLLLSKSMDGTYVISIDRTTKAVPANVVESSRRFPEQSRFSCDDRRLLRPAETQEAKKPPSTRAKELPRLSLDSRKESLSPSSRLKSYSYRRTDDSLLDALKPQDSPGHRRSNSVIAKLMGLEEAPDAMGMLIADSYEPARSPRTAAQATRSERPSRSPRRDCQDACGSLPKNEPSALKTRPPPRILTEAAPWRQQERGGSATNSKASQCRDAEVRPRTASLYADIERRLGGLEFSECNKDFRALRILGALHAKDAKHQNNDGDAASVASQSQEEDSATTSSRSFQSPIVVMKPARTTEKPGVAPLAGLRGLRKLQPRDSSFTDKSEASTNEKIHSCVARAQSKSDEPTSRASSPRPAGSSSPRLVQRKAESERRSRPPVSPKSPSKKANEAASPRGRTRSKPSQVKSNRDNEVSQSPGRRISLAKQIDVSIMDCQNPLAARSSFIDPKTPSQKSPSSILGSDHKIHSLENALSPVSVLDTSFYHKSISDQTRKPGGAHSET
ncbi:unnamed protein product [Triticum turgidum subsp. durum]|uniref:DUF3741 domain-containing protein n=1 Tax=Triticum turgidum subsp. durum TaxID=4567 RepID=A0A9R1PIK5_TRITD|nr:unnamed protein product [Triticum turgidum subsp. durum]